MGVRALPDVTLDVLLAAAEVYARRPPVATCTGFAELVWRSLGVPVETARVHLAVPEHRARDSVTSALHYTDPWGNVQHVAELTGQPVRSLAELAYGRVYFVQGWSVTHRGSVVIESGAPGGPRAAEGHCWFALVHPSLSLDGRRQWVVFDQRGVRLETADELVERWPHLLAVEVG